MADDGAGERAVVPRVRRAGLTPGSAALLVVTVVGAFLLRDVFVAAHRTIGWVVACSVVALLIDPLVDFVDRLLPRWIAVIVVLLGVLTVVATVTVGLDQRPARVARRAHHQRPAAAKELEQQHDCWPSSTPARGSRTSSTTSTTASARTPCRRPPRPRRRYLVTSILMLFLLAYGRRYFEGFVDQFPERRQRRHAHGRPRRRAARPAVPAGRARPVRRQRGHRRVGVLGARASRPPSASGFAVGVFTLLPLIGVLVGGIPALLLGFGLEGWQDGLIVLLVLIALQTIEAAVIRPIVDARTVRVGPTIPIVVALLGFELYGVGGALYGIALAVIGLAALDAVGRLRGDDPALDRPAEPEPVDAGRVRRARPSPRPDRRRAVPRPGRTPAALRGRGATSRTRSAECRRRDRNLALRRLCAVWCAPHQIRGVRLERDRRAIAPGATGRRRRGATTGATAAAAARWGCARAPRWSSWIRATAATAPRARWLPAGHQADRGRRPASTASPVRSSSMRCRRSSRLWRSSQRLAAAAPLAELLDAARPARPSRRPGVRSAARPRPSI